MVKQKMNKEGNDLIGNKQSSRNGITTHFRTFETGNL